MKGRAVKPTYFPVSHASFVVQHGAGKPTPWRVRGTPLGVGPAGGPSQLPDSEDINAAMAAAGDLAACFPSTQAEQEVVAPVAAHTTGDPPSSTGTTAAAAAAAPTSKPAAASTDEDGVQGVADHAALPQQPGASTAAEHGHDPKAAFHSGHTSAEAEDQQAAAAEADSRSADEASHAQPDEAADVQSHRGAGPRQASRRKQAGRAAAVDEEEQEDHGSAGGRGRGRGSRGKGRGQAKGRKRSSPDAETEEDAARVGKPQVITAACLVVKCTALGCTTSFYGMVCCAADVMLHYTCCIICQLTLHSGTTSHHLFHCVNCQ